VTPADLRDVLTALGAIGAGAWLFGALVLPWVLGIIPPRNRRG
jgi:hypothetical protein